MRATIKFYDNYKYLCAIYKQFDGYPSYLGANLANKLAITTMVNGFKSEQHSPDFANGFGCLVAQFISEIKEDIGDVYITTEEDEQDYNYIVNYNKTFQIEVTDYSGETIFEGDLKAFEVFCGEENVR